MELLTGELTAQTILEYSNANHASDIHLAPMSYIMVRVDGELIPISDHILKPEETYNIIRPMMTDTQWKELEQKGELDFAYTFPGFSRVRVNAFRQRGTYGMAMRILSFMIPTPQQLGLPRSVVDLTNRKRGLVLVTGATGFSNFDFLFYCFLLLRHFHISLFKIIAYRYEYKRHELQDGGT